MNGDVLLRRTYPVELTEGDGRTLYGLCVPYDEPATVLDPELSAFPYEEMIARGAFAKDVRLKRAANRVELRYEHGEGLFDVTGYGVAFEDREVGGRAGLWGEFRALESQAGDQALALHRAGILRHLSVGIYDKRSKREGGVMVRHSVRLGEVSLVREAAYKGTEAMVRRAPGFDFERPARDAELDRRLAVLGFRE